MWMAGLIELSIFLVLAGVVAWVFFKPVKKKNTNSDDKNK